MTADIAISVATGFEYQAIVAGELVSIFLFPVQRRVAFLPKRW